MSISPAEFITLRQFQGGFGWHGRLTYDIKRKYRARVADIDESTAREIAARMNGAFVEEKIYPAVKWAMIFNPFGKLRISFVFDENDEFGANLYFFLGREALDVIPTEDAAVFTQCYLSVISRYREYLLSEAGSGGKPVSIYELEKQKREEFAKYFIGERDFLMKHIKSEVARKAAPELKADFTGKEDEHWRIKVSPLFDLDIYYVLRNNEILDVLISEAAACKYLVGIFMGFAWLYANEFIRAAQRLDPEMPRISRYM